MGGRWPRQRRGELIVGVACIAFAVLSMVGVAGLVPGVLTGSPVSFSQKVPVCSRSTSVSQPTRSVTIPAWASVHFTWSVEPSGLLVGYQVASASLNIVYYVAAMNGTGSFESAGGSYQFFPEFVEYVPPPPSPTCTTAVVTVTVTYAP
jgi:hypothetical protein